MSKALRMVSVVNLVLAVTALVFGVMLFHKRELLKLRTQKLEDALITVAATVEAGEPVVVAAAAYPERDVGSVTHEVDSDPPRSRFWREYRTELEVPDGKIMDVGSRRGQLGHLYRIDPVTLKPMRDELTGQKLMYGPGTMQALLDEVSSRAEAQLGRLNDTRQMLEVTRSELVTTITELNRRKHDARVALRTLRERDASIAGLLEEIERRDGELALGREENALLVATIADVKAEMARKDEEIEKLEDDCDKLAVQLAEAIGMRPRGGAANSWPAFTRGVKGAVVSVDTNWNFVAMHFTPEFVAQYSRMCELSEDAPDPDLLVLRGGNGDDSFVTKVKLCWINPDERLGVANILNAWQQASVRVGDTVAY